MSVKKVTAYEANGILYTDKQDAEMALLRGQAIQIVEAKVGRLKGLGLDAEGVLDELLDLGWPLVNLLSSILRRHKTPNPNT